MRVVQEPGFILHHHPYGETSLTLEIFTRGFGRLGVLAKGARRGKPAARANFAPFQPVLLGWSGRGELPVLTQIEADAGVSSYLAGRALLCAFYLNELILRLIQREDPHETLFIAYQNALAALANEPTQEATLRVFEKRLLRAVGYGLVLDRDINDEMIVPEADYRYLLDRGPSLATRGHEGIPITGANLLALEQERLGETSLSEVKQLLRAALAPHIGDRPLQSRRLFQRLGAAPGSNA